MVVDLSAAYDTVNHSRMSPQQDPGVHKGHPPYKVIESMLENRLFFVELEEEEQMAKTQKWPPTGECARLTPL